ncbi:MAG: HEAT repeat domain-containing protein [Candidatus Hydrogenedentes bacterium]|nr:HEAT repeat domain-containing protein [Candidatus Hydrogenedentota bacterium]
MFWFVVSVALVNADAAPGIVADAPSACAVYERLGELWRSREFSVLDRYVDTLDREHPGYVPATLARIVARYLDGARSEVVVVELTKLLNEVEPLMPLVSPDFVEAVKVKIKRHEKLIELLEPVGLSPDERLNRFSRKRMDTNSLDEHGFEVLFLFAPEINLPVSLSDIDKWLKKPQTELQVNEDEFQRALKVLQQGADAPRQAERDAISTLGTMRNKEALGYLCDLLVGTDDVRAAWAAEAVSSFGEDAVSSLLTILQEPALHPTKRRIIWALVRIHAHRADVRQVVEQEGQKARLLREYVDQALRYLP